MYRASMGTVDDFGGFGVKKIRPQAKMPMKSTTSRLPRNADLALSSQDVSASGVKYPQMALNTVSKDTFDVPMINNLRSRIIG